MCHVRELQQRAVHPHRVCVDRDIAHGLRRTAGGHQVAVWCDQATRVQERRLEPGAVGKPASAPGPAESPPVPDPPRVVSLAWAIQWARLSIDAHVAGRPARLLEPAAVRIDVPGTLLPPGEVQPEPVAIGADMPAVKGWLDQESKRRVHRLPGGIPTASQWAVKRAPDRPLAGYHIGPAPAPAQVGIVANPDEAAGRTVRRGKVEIPRFAPQAIGAGPGYSGRGSRGRHRAGR